MTTDYRQSQIISTVLSPALKLWLRSQVEHLEGLELQIMGGDRQIMGGYIPKVFLAAAKGIYQGIHLDQVAITAENIRINVGQVLRGKPLNILEPIALQGNLALSENSINQSLASPLLTSGLTDFLTMLLQQQEILKNNQVTWKKITLREDKFILEVNLVDSQGNSTPLTVRSGLGLFNPHTLLFHPLIVESPNFSTLSLEQFTIDLGTEVQLKHLNLSPSNLECSGGLKVMP